MKINFFSENKKPSGTQKGKSEKDNGKRKNNYKTNYFKRNSHIKLNVLPFWNFFYFVDYMANAREHQFNIQNTIRFNEKDRIQFKRFTETSRTNV